MFNFNINDSFINFGEEDGVLIYSNVPEEYLGKKGWNIEKLNNETSLSEIIHIIGRDEENGCVIEYNGIDGDDYFATFGDTINLLGISVSVVKKLFEQNRWDIINMRPKRGILEFDLKKIHDYMNTSS